MVRTMVVAFLMGLAGFAIAWGGWHLYLDHQLVDAARETIRQQQAAPQR